MASVRAVALSCITLLCLVAACDDSSPRPDETLDASVPLMCTGDGEALCGGACVSTVSDPAHCGGCDTACASSEACKAGACVVVCRIDGQQVTTGTQNAANACEQCVPAMSSTTWTPRADGTACAAGQVCAAGACGPKCCSDGVLYAPGARNPANACEVCVPETSTTAWSTAFSTPLLAGGTDIAAQGWTVVAQTPNTLTYGEDYVRLETSTASGGQTSGQLLITKADAFDATKPFTVRVTLQVESVNRHNSLDSGAAILGSFTRPFGSATDRSQMVYLDSAAIGWADETQSTAFAVTDSAYHVYELAVDAAKAATLSVDGAVKLTRSNFTATGIIAIGDQTNDPNVDGAMRIKSVELLCR